MVVGAGIAGLLAAEVLGRRFDRVLLLERDAVQPDGSCASRRGVPQGDHPHVLLLGGLEALQSLWPDVKEQLLMAGAVEIDWGQTRSYDLGRYAPRTKGVLQGTTARRSVTEGTIRRLVAHNPRVRILGGAMVKGLLANEGGDVVGVELTDGRCLSSDLVVDASGRGSNLPRWLQQLGVPPPQEKVVDAHLSYVSARVRWPAEAVSADKAASLLCRAPPCTRRPWLLRHCCAPQSSAWQDCSHLREWGGTPAPLHGVPCRPAWAGGWEE